jgi:anaphase-promoting complex subunit 3
MAKYQDAEKMYRKVIQAEPYRLEGLEYYSTCLWHLKKQVELCYLSNHALEKSLFAPETWCVVGNCYSLQKEHETALKFFSRAIQLNTNFAYAHTLCGHEYVANEDFDSAKKCYQRALAADERHYNAWWGLGNINLKQEKFD